MTGNLWELTSSWLWAGLEVRPAEVQQGKAPSRTRVLCPTVTSSKGSQGAFNDLRSSSPPERCSGTADDRRTNQTMIPVTALDCFCLAEADQSQLCIGLCLLPHTHTP